MSGPCLYHSYGTHKAAHSMRDCQLNEQLIKEKGNNPGGDLGNNKAAPQFQQPANTRSPEAQANEDSPRTYAG